MTSTTERTETEYDDRGEVDLDGFRASLAAYGTFVAGSALLLKASGRSLPESYSMRDLVVGGVAVHKFSRLLARGSVTSPLRAPFTEFEEAAGAAEHDERPRQGHGVRHTVGELLTCPFCLGVWIGTTYVAGLAVAPRQARAWAAVFGVVGASDFLQHVYGRVNTA